MHHSPPAITLFTSKSNQTTTIPYSTEVSAQPQMGNAIRGCSCREPPNLTSTKAHASSSLHAASSSRNKDLQRIKLVYSKKEQELMAHYLPNFVCTKPSTQLDLLVVRDHWERLHQFHQIAFGGNSDRRFVRKFYDALFQRAPQLRRLFGGSKHTQRKALMNLVKGIQSLLQSNDLLEHAAQITQCHMDHGVQMEHFNGHGIALLETLTALAPQCWTPEVDRAWKAVYCHVSVLLLTIQQQMQLDLKSKPGATSRQLWTIRVSTCAVECGDDSELEGSSCKTSCSSPSHTTSDHQSPPHRQSTGSIKELPVVCKLTRRLSDQSASVGVSPHAPELSSSVSSIATGASGSTATCSKEAPPPQCPFHHLFAATATTTPQAANDDDDDKEVEEANALEDD